MSLIKKIDVKKHFADRRAKRRAEARPVSQPGATAVPATKASGAKTNAQALVEDFPLEHSASSGSDASIE
jgi:hypothetical protein